MAFRLNKKHVMVSDHLNFALTFVNLILNLTFWRSLGFPDIVAVREGHKCISVKIKISQKNANVACNFASFAQEI